jgi:predicted ATPase
LQQHPLDEAHLRLRAGIIRLNERHGLLETSARGYFETLTRVWLVLVADARARSAASSSRELLERCSELCDRSLPYRYYSKALLASVRARAIFLAPDLEPLPPVP